MLRYLVVGPCLDVVRGNRRKNCLGKGQFSPLSFGVLDSAFSNSLDLPCWFLLGLQKESFGFQRLVLFTFTSASTIFIDISFHSLSIFSLSLIIDINIENYRH